LEAVPLEMLLANHDGQRGALIPLLHAVQHELGYVPDAMVAPIAEALNLSRADVHGVLTFYSDFRRKPAGRHVIRLCRAEACQARGSAEVEERLSQALGVAVGATSEDGQVTLEPTYCLGLCAIGPAMLVDGKPVARVDAAKASQLAAELGA
jgi:formate dehydrogenase subunit gamma